MADETSKAKQLLRKLIEVDKVINTLSHGNPDWTGQESLASVGSIRTVAASKVTNSVRGGRNSSLRPVVDEGRHSISTTRHAPAEKKHKSKKQTTKSVVSSDFMKPQSTYCPMCFSPMGLGLLRKHMAEECPNNEISCTEVDCKARFTADHLKVHLEKECIPARRRKALIEQMRLRKEEQKEELAQLQEKAVTEHKKRKAEEERIRQQQEDEALAMAAPRSSGGPVVKGPSSPSSPAKISTGVRPALKEVCAQCLQELPAGTNVQHHMTESCPSRLVYCPNQSGCQKRVPFNLLDEHLARDCVVEKMKNSLVANALARCAPAKCNGCGKLVPLKYLHKHEVDECVNRKVPCRNAHLGCQVMVRAKERARHEQVDGKAKVRYCIYIGGEGAYFDLGEDDLRCPWTMEMWLYRPSAREAAKQHIRCLLQEAPLFVDAFIMEHVWRLQMLQLTDTLGDSSMPQEEREEVMVVLADTVEALEDAVVKTTEMFARLGCCVAAARGAMQEFLGTKFDLIVDKRKREQARGKELLLELMCLKRYAPGYVAPVSETRSRPTTQGTSRPTTGAELSRPGSSSSFSDGGGGRNSSLLMHETGGPTNGTTRQAKQKQKKREVVPWVQPLASPAESSLGAILSLVYPEEIVDFVNRFKDDREYRKREAAEKAAEKARMAEEKRLRQERADRGEPEPEPEQVTEREGEGGEEGGVGEEKKKDDEDGEVNMAKTGEIEGEGEEDPFALAMREKQKEQAAAAAAAAAAAEEEQGPLFELPPPPALLLLTALKDGAGTGSRAQGGTALLSPEAVTSTLSWLQWIEVLELVQASLVGDLGVLQDMRIESGLMKERKGGLDVDGTEEVKQDGEGPAAEEETEEEREARLRREQEEKEKADRAAAKEAQRLRREMKKNKGKKAVMEEIAAAEIAAATAEGDGGGEDGEGGDDRPTQEQIERQRRAAEREARRATREKLQFRMDDAAKAGAGRDTLIFTERCNGRGRRNKICLDMSYLGDEEMQSMASKGADGKPSALGATWMPGRGGGHAGVVCSDGPMGHADYYSFGKPVPREKWVQVSFVGVRDEAKEGGQGSHITMFLDGFSGGQVKGISFPLPLASFGGSPGLDSWSGCILDTRIWSKPRSAMEIGGTKNVLLNLEGPREPAMPTYDLTIKGLVGWWTFEDGPKDPEEEQIDDAVDVSEHRAPTVLKRSLPEPNTNPDHAGLYNMNAFSSTMLSLQKSGEYVDVQELPLESKRRFWNWENADEVPLPNETETKPGEDRPLPVPAFSAIGLCPYELHRLRLAQKGRLLHKQVNCPLGCDAFILKKDLRFHVSFLCEMRHVKCRFAPFCPITFPEYERSAHEENMCPHLAQRRVLERRYRELSQLVECSKCGSVVRRRDQVKHDQEQCPHRLVICPHADCGLEMAAHQLKYHLKFDCDSDKVQTRAIMIERSRERLNYPRDWAGTIIEFDKFMDRTEDALFQYRGRRRALMKTGGGGAEGEGGSNQGDGRGSSGSGSRSRSGSPAGGGYRTIQPHEIGQPDESESEVSI